MTIQTNQYGRLRWMPALCGWLAIVFLSTAVCPAVVLDITDYGAVANDGNNDSTAIRNAIAAAGSGDTVYAPAGVFDIHNIELKSNIKFLGAGRDSTTYRMMPTNNYGSAVLWTYGPSHKKCPIGIDRDRG